MVRRVSAHRAVLIAAAFAATGPVAAQGLGDAAKRAEERRKASTNSIVIDTLPPAPVDSGPPRLSPDVLQRYLNARLALADLRRADKQIEARLYTGRMRAQHYDDLHPIYAAESYVVDLFSRFSLSTSAYLQIEAAMYRGRDYAGYPSLSVERLTPRDRENVDFVKANMGLVRAIFDRAGAAERGLRFYGRIPDFH